MFLRTYSADISLISPQGDHELSADQRMRLEEAGVALVNGPCEPLRIEGERILVPTPNGGEAYDTAYPALGSIIRAELAMMLGAEATDDGRSEERRVGNECVSTCRSRWSPSHYNKQTSKLTAAI